ncbi:MAG TPA: acyl-CoA synthetase FdrA [Hyphomicrobiaceae bacterium]|nr:acyl-CoA synthetase FdrA [Hyphomicrobiaceae bacterium]
MSRSVRNAVRRAFYLDSVALMRLSREIAALEGVLDAALMMATPANKAILAEAGLIDAEAEAAGANDLILAVSAEAPDRADAALAAAQVLLAPRARPNAAPRGHSARSLRTALGAQPDANLALISVPGDYAAGEARRALGCGLDVMIFSDNVPLAEEVALKRQAQALGRLLLGPDCGTAILGGAPLGFANRVPRGDIGLIGASGTGLQEVSVLIAAAGRGVSEAIGVGSRDLSLEVEALATLAAIDLLDQDPATARIVLISKPPHPEVVAKVLARIGRSPKRFTLCFLGAAPLELPGNATAVPTLRAAAEDVLGSSRTGKPDVAPTAKPRAGHILGLYAGGTLGAEAQLLLIAAGRIVASNTAVPGARALSGAPAGVDQIIDLGADEFTRGRPHPMIDPASRCERLGRALEERGVAAVLLDVVLGYGAHADPAGEIATVIERAPANRPHVVACVVGTEADPQVRSRQVAALRAAGVLVARSNAGAAELALALAQG